MTFVLMILASFSFEPWSEPRVCDQAWFALRGATLGPTGAYWDERAQECKQADDCGAGSYCGQCEPLVAILAKYPEAR